MPNMYSHLVLSKIFLENCPTDNFDLDNFYFGTSVPDIGYFSKIERKITHFYNLDPEKYFEDSAISEKSFLKGYKLHLYLDNIWKYEIRLKNNISIEENALIYNYFDGFLKNKFNIELEYFKNFILNGNCGFLRKLNIDKITCENWKKGSFYNISEFEVNKNYQKIVEEYLKIC
ncbi:conserved hypothetical protein [Methanococcus maripaludis C5]|uniref:Acyl carrier protein phosphodiesterase n=1 Tax=Methanococcus maripaludis (strain C5 / ATCC BAA-1333) TaxID=402880 RepID=A4G080_METM5|nr:hypothetical protein [Methanococcus maripaludis]ABO35864.1 conserved hypothetical protein [Methanococcus maripaludis C5]